MSDSPANTHDENADDHGHGDHHVVSFGFLLTVFVALLILTVITVGVSEARLSETLIGDIALPVAMIVAVIKGSLVCLFFMHLWWDSLFNSVAVVAALAFVALFLALAVLDTSEYRVDQTEYNRVYPAVSPVKPPDVVAPEHGDPDHNHATDH